MAHIISSTAMQAMADGYAVNPKAEQTSKTVGQVMDERIMQARQTVERECIAKAKLEALGVLDHHASLYNNIYSHEDF